MNSIIKTLLAIMLPALAVTAQAAQPDNNQTRRANLNALRLIQDYENYSNLLNDDAVENLRYIFGNDSAMVYNDLPGLAAGEQITLDKYIELLGSTRGIRSVVRNITAGPIADGGRVWLLTVTFQKGMEYNIPFDSNNSAIIRSREYYDGKDFDMTAVVEVDKDTYESHLRSLTGSVASNRPRLTPGFALIRKNDPRDNEVTNGGHRLAFNSNDQAFISQPFDLQFADDDVKLSVDTAGTEGRRVFSFRYKPTRWRVRPYADIALGGAWKVDAPDGMNASNSGMSMGVDVGYVLPSRGKVKVGIFSGLGFATGKIDLDVASLSYSYQAGPEADMDGDSYIRHYELTDMQQSIKLSHFTLPVYADIEFRASRRFSIFAQAGIKAYFNAGSKIDRYSGSVYSYGVYPQYDDLRLDESWLNGFGNSEIASDKVNDEGLFKGFSADLLLGIGARIKIYGPLSLDLGLSYMNPLIDRMDNKEFAPLPSGSTSAGQAPVTYTVAGGTVSTKPLSSYCDIKSNPLRLKAGLTFRF